MKLRYLCDKDAPLMLEWMQDKELVKDLHKNFELMNIDNCRAFIQTANYETETDLHMAITDDNDEYMGTVSLKNIDKADRFAEFGIVTRRKVLGTGIAHDAMVDMLRKAYNELGLDRVCWCVSPDNIRALRFYDKNNYRRISIKDYPIIYNSLCNDGTYSQADIDNYIWYIDEAVDVSVYMMTYFHEKYVRQAIESVLSQKTHYKFELVISDDCSQDGTAGILREYETKYPELIRVNINELNLGIPANIYKARTMCRGRYITNLSGDDYWIDDNKIETEAGFLDANPDYSAAACRIELRMDDNNTAYSLVPAENKMLNRPYTLADYEKCIPLGTHGLFMRNFFLTEEGRKYFAQAQKISEYVDDAVDEVLLLRKGPIYVLDLVSDVHRVVSSDIEHKNYNSRYSRVDKFRHHIELLNNMNELWGDEIDFSGWYANYTATGILSMILSRQFGAYKQIIDTIPVTYKKPFFRSIYIRWIPYACALVVGRTHRSRS
ncbi:MAG: GNAT family N-acetyltransferase [Lachnospiraceae bacterium]|nr:GNAT family N-acetyltransferase [Lachnospiraceae bacterium]